MAGVEPESPPAPGSQSRFRDGVTVLLMWLVEMHAATVPDSQNIHDFTLDGEHDTVDVGPNVGCPPPSVNARYLCVRYGQLSLVPGAGIEPALSLRKNGF